MFPHSPVYILMCKVACHRNRLSYKNLIRPKLPHADPRSSFVVGVSRYRGPWSTALLSYTCSSYTAALPTLDWAGRCWHARVRTAHDLTNSRSQRLMRSADRFPSDTGEQLRLQQCIPPQCTPPPVHPRAVVVRPSRDTEQGFGGVRFRRQTTGPETDYDKSVTGDARWTVVDVVREPSTGVPVVNDALDVSTMSMTSIIMATGCICWCRMCRKSTVDILMSSPESIWYTGDDVFPALQALSADTLTQRYHRTHYISIWNIRRSYSSDPRMTR